MVGKDGRTWRVPQSLVNELAVAFPSVDVVAEGRKARTWCVANPAKRKTAKGMAKFLFNWITRAVNSGNAAILAGARGSPKAQSTGPALCQFHADRHTAGKPSRFPKPDTCSECKHVAALSRPRSPAGAPSSLGDILGGGS